VGHLFILYDRSYRLCRQHLSEVPKLISAARQRIHAFVTLTLYDPDLIVAVAQKMSQVPTNGGGDPPAKGSGGR
jgi:hypothetical protein